MRNLGLKYDRKHLSYVKNKRQGQVVLVLQLSTTP
jgi:hypothetical protein